MHTRITTSSGEQADSLSEPTLTQSTHNDEEIVFTGNLVETVRSSLQLSSDINLSAQATLVQLNAECDPKVYSKE